MLRITSFKVRASGRTANAGRERPLTAARVGAGCARRRGIIRRPRKHERAPAAVCTENPIRVDDVTESPKLAE